MDLYTPAQLEALTGLSVASQSAWRKSGFLNDRGHQPKGAHWRFTRDDILYVAAVRAMGDKGVALGAAAMLVDSCFSEISGAFTGEPHISSTPSTYAFVWKRDDCTREAEAAFPSGDFVFEDSIENLEYARSEGSYKLLKPHTYEDGLTIHQSGEWCATIMGTLELIPRLTRAGGSIIILSDLPRNIPRAVADLFKADAGK